MNEEIKHVSMGCVECVDGITVGYTVSYPLRIWDAGRSTSRRPKQKDDCTVRALVAAWGDPYDHVYDLLAAAGRKCGRGFNISVWLNARPTLFTKIPFPAVKGQRRMNPVTFVQQYPTGTYICQVAKHVFAVVDGVVIDTFESRCDRCIYAAWRVL